MLRGGRAFAVVSTGQILSLVGSGLTTFLLGIWVYQQTGSASLFALIGVCRAVPGLLISPLAGTLVDRWNRRTVMIGADAASALATAAILWLLWADGLALWHVYATALVHSLAAAFQIPAYTAAVSTLVPREQLGRANGVMQLGEAASFIISPLVAGALYGTAPLHWLVAADLATFGIAVACLAVARFPAPRPTGEDSATLLDEMRFGLRWLGGHPGLRALLGFFTLTTFAFGAVYTLLTPMMLAIAGPAELGQVMAAAGVGMLIGAIAMGAWGGPRRRVLGVLGFSIAQGAALLVGGSQPQFAVILGSAFAFLLVEPFVTGCNQAIWQATVPEGAQGRVFATRRVIGEMSWPVGAFLAGPLADLAQGALDAGGPLGGAAAAVVGAGPGRGAGLVFCALGVCILAAVAWGATRRSLLQLDAPSPDLRPIPQGGDS